MTDSTYFTNPRNLLPNQRATAGSVTSDFDLVGSGFAMLPEPTDIKQGKVRYAVDTGAVNAMVANNAYAPPSLTDGFLISVKAGNTVTGATTLNVNGKGAKDLLRPDGTPLNSGDIQAGQFFDARYNGTSFLLTALNVYPAAGAGTSVTQPPGTNSTLIATTAFVTAAISALSSLYLTIANAVATYAPKASPTFTGTVTVPTQAAGDNSTKAANTAFVNAALQALYPIGSIYCNGSNSSNPSTLLGFGNWSQCGQSRVLVGQDGANPICNTAGQTGGSADSTLPSHSHTGSADNSGNHSHGYLLPPDSGFGSTVGSSGRLYNFLSTVSTDSAGNHTHNLSINSAGSSPTNTNYPPYLVVYMWIRTS